MKLLIDVPADEAVITRLRAEGHAVDCLVPPAEKSREVEPARLAEAEALFCSFPPRNFADLQRLRWVQVASAGYAQLFGLDLPGRGIRATNALGCFDVPIAEWVVAMMVNLARDLRQLIRNQEATVWDRSAAFQREIRGLTVGIWGYGGIGRETARLARQMGLRVHVMTRRGAGRRGLTYCVPGTGDPEGVLPARATEGLSGEAELQARPRTAFVLNPARGPIIREAALLRALREKWIAGAALDTHYQYPLPVDHPLWRFPNVITFQHISGSSLSPRFQERIWDIFEQNLARYGEGQPLLNELTPEQLAGS